MFIQSILLCSCTDVFSRCTVGYEVMDCCSIFKEVLTTYGYCYTLQINKTSLGTLEMETLPFIIDLHVPPSNSKFFYMFIKWF